MLLNFILWQLIVVMASHCYLSGQPAEMAVEFLIRHCAITDEEIDNSSSISNNFLQLGSSQYKRLEVSFYFFFLYFFG